MMPYRASEQTLLSAKISIERPEHQYQEVYKVYEIYVGFGGGQCKQSANKRNTPTFQPTFPR
jgi:hypothetical protein